MNKAIQNPNYAKKNFKDKNSNLRLERKQDMSVQNRDHDFFQCANYFKRK